MLSINNTKHFSFKILSYPKLERPTPQIKYGVLLGGNETKASWKPSTLLRHALQIIIKKMKDNDFVDRGNQY